MRVRWRVRYEGEVEGMGSSSREAVWLECRRDRCLGGESDLGPSQV